ncbi:prepilin-type N-terminal cleavage/methylation domain-containing protein [Candidatus Saccharibacteria bacterium]|nr:prepilin-type N-terminal cleavage/methylation domain-containing protein [Candidatus Saccharibacteria bacterium]
MKKQESGFTMIEVVLVIAVVGVLAGAGWLLWSRRNHSASQTASNTNSQPTTTANSGTCFGVSKATIKSLLGAPAANLQDLSDTGVKDIVI